MQHLTQSHTSILHSLLTVIVVSGTAFLRMMAACFTPSTSMLKACAIYEEMDWWDMDQCSPMRREAQLFQVRS